jgi:hypothetical protein
MNARVVQILTLVAVVVGALALVLDGTTSPARTAHAVPPLASHFSRPLPEVVVVTPTGKLFHDPTCTHVHGPADRIPLAEAERLGYTACPWCLPTAR